MNIRSWMGTREQMCSHHFGSKQGCPLLFSIYLSDIDCLAEEVRDALTSIPNFMVTHSLFADYLSLMSNDHTNVQTMLNKLRAYVERKSLIVNTVKSEEMCFGS
eukprot:578740-Pelagomonas_calceolata.AAC.1